VPNKDKGSPIDLALAEDLRRRDPDAIARILERYGHEIQAVAQLIVRDRAEAEDILIETLVTTWRRGPTLRDAAALRPWLLRIATNHSLSWRRRVGSRLWPPAPAGTTPDHAASTDTRLTVLAEVDRLPMRMRAAVVLHYYADLPVDQVAALLGRSPNTIKAQLRVALERIRKGLSTERAADPEAKRARP
jgi:RNA polymerase sigma-70 factor, ECF subfamily